MSIHHATFDATGDFCAYNEAKTFLNGAGFSVGSTCSGLPTAIMFGNYRIAKWRNLTWKERDDSHGVINGSVRNGPVTVEIWSACPPDGVAAFTAALAKATGQ